MLTALLGLFFFTRHQLPWYGASFFRFISAMNLQAILTTRRVCEGNGLVAVQVDECARRDLGQSYGGVSEYRRLYCARVAMEDWAESRLVFVHLGAIAFFLLFLMLAYRGRVRRIYGGFLLLVALVLGDAIAGNPLVKALLPSGYRYIDDYVYLANTDVMPSSARIVAYERRKIGALRVVGMADGRAWCMDDRKLIELLRAQGNASEAASLMLPSP